MLSLLRAMPGSVAQGLLWGIMALGVYLTYKVLDFADLTVDGSICTGGAVAALGILNGLNPWLVLIFSFVAGMAAGCITGLLHTALGIPPILSGILTQLALYSINMRIMGQKSNLTISIEKYDLVVSIRNNGWAVLVGALFAAAVIGLLYWFFGTEIGCATRATGCNAAMARAQGINTNFIKVLGLALSNGLVGLAGGLYAQYQGNADVNMGRGAIVIGLASVIIGEVLGEAIFGKYFNFACRLATVVVGGIIYYIDSAFVLWLGIVDTNDLKLFSAVTVAVFLALPYLRGKRREKAARKGAKADA